MPLSPIVFAILASTTPAPEIVDTIPVFNKASFAPKLTPEVLAKLGDDEEPTEERETKDLLDRPSVPAPSLPPTQPAPPPTVIAIPVSPVAAPAASIPVPAELRSEWPVAAVPMAPPPVVALPNALAPQTNVTVVHHPVDPRALPKSPVLNGTHTVSRRPALGMIARKN